MLHLPRPKARSWPKADDWELQFELELDLGGRSGGKPGPRPRHRHRNYEMHLILLHTFCAVRRIQLHSSAALRGLWKIYKNSIAHNLSRWHWTWTWTWPWSSSTDRLFKEANVSVQLPTGWQLVWTRVLCAIGRCSRVYIAICPQSCHIVLQLVLPEVYLPSSHPAHLMSSEGFLSYI